MGDSWRPSGRLGELRSRLRAEYARPSRRWSDLAVTCMTVAVGDGRAPSERLADVAHRQTALRYEP